MTKHTDTSQLQQKNLVSVLKEMLKGGHAHVTFEQAVDKLPAALRGVVPEGLPYSIWQLVEHIRITQWDILEFSRDPAHKSPAWPDEYWPTETAPSDETAWKRTLNDIASDTKAFIALLESPDADLYTPFSHGDGQNLLREAILIVDHTSYHTGEIILLRRMLGAWD
ncbi:DinB family protein [Filimonas effusa]|uniref:DinB family protein n=1 Tax=Filimonas effusa TaxID=2508721 RepID=A0A4Q1DB38_9BACT|nr:DinB family protein [Filimonas effusa]RXK86128.1 DinB family protein [Filimonas effusa]